MRQRHLVATLALLAACDSEVAVVIGDSDAGTIAPRDVPAARDAPTTLDLPTVVDAPAALDVPSALDVPTALDAPDVPARCARDADCSAPTPVCDVGTGACVRCTATQEDACAPSEHCDPGTNRCVPGCRADEGCAADGGLGRCDRATHTCVACVRDGDCGAGRLCVGSVCVPGCTPAQPCPLGQSCCNGGCVDFAANVAHCGACGNVCRTANGVPGCSNGVCVTGMCAAGFGDCNARSDDGCEVSLGSDLSHCGMCGNACPTRPNAAAATCVAGRCGFTCAPGFADCDNDPGNGCEVDLRGSAAHCGLCGNACPTRPNASAATCVAGRCDVTCAAGFGNCDADAANGCEQDLLGALGHCGRCGNACPTRANTVATCVAGACGGTCNAGFGDCDGMEPTGCETNLNTALNACGACGRACAVANGTPACNAGACVVASCNAGFADCDRNAANGCEVDLTRDANNCGACGTRRAELCDGVDNSCNGVVDEGCPVGIAGLGSFDFQSPSWGGGGGGPYDLQCPSGQFVTGVFGRSGARIDAFGIVCGTPRFVEDRSVSPFRYRVDVSTSGTVGPVGGGGGGPYRYDCPANSVVMRVEGRSGARVDQLRVECFRWDIAQDGGAWRISRSPATGGSAFFGAGGGGPFDYVCPAGSTGAPSAVRRAFGGAGAELDRVGVWCTWPVLNLR